MFKKRQTLKKDIQVSPRIHSQPSPLLLRGKPFAVFFNLAEYRTRQQGTYILFLFLHKCMTCSVFVYLFQLACQLCLFTHTNSYIFSSSNCFNCSQKFWYFEFSFSSKILWFPFLRWHLWSMDFSEVYCLIAKCWEIFLLYLWLVLFCF